MQRGRGIGNLLGSLFRSAVPAIKSLGKSIFSSNVVKDVGKSLANSAVKGGLNFAADALDGQNLKESLSSNVGEAKSALAKVLRNNAAPPAPAKVQKRLPKRVPRAPPPKRRRRVTRPPPRRSLFEEEDDDDDSDGSDGSSAAAE